MIKRTLIPTLLLTSSVATAAPPPDDQVPTQLLELRGELVEAGEEGALGARARFSPLCDDAGYPLVGNLLPKDGADAGPMAPMDGMDAIDAMYQPSEFCAEVRKDKRDA